ncbi:MAG TPA: tetratricopeptide repeat protein, partial [Candidatus Saccharimonadales bacterium]|nr:tetratricopeptide repeat protein [Candidatus Saccharimonadales bacterium]
SGQHAGTVPTPKRRWGLAALAILALVASGSAFLWLRSSAPEAPAVAEAPAAAGTAAIPERKKIVVLPFENLGPAEDAYFADGMTEEITSRLAVAGGLGVISRTSAFQYDRRGKSIKDVGKDLGVDYVLEGSIRWARGPGDSSRVRITPQLIRVSDDTHLWADTYDRKIDDIFQVQTEIAENVIKQLGIVLRDPERTAIGSRPTENVASYQSYLRGIALARGPDAITEEGSTAAVSMLQRAVELDPNFALAWAELSQAQSLRYHLGYERTEAQRQRALDAVERAEALAPGSPETHLALGYYHYWALQEYDKALEEFDIVRRERPNDVNTLAAIGFVHRRQGLWKEAVADFKKALELDPLHANLTGELGSSLVFMRDYAGAIPILDRSIAIEPDQRRAYRFKALDDLLWKGDTAAARAVFEGTFDPGDPTVSMSWYSLVLFEGRYEEARDFVTGLPVEVLQDQAAFYPVELLEAMALDKMGQAEKAKAAYDGARRFLLQAIEASPDDHRLHSALGIALAGLGRKEEAIREGRKAVDLYPISQDAYAAPERVADLARIYAMTGDPSAAIDQLDLLLSVPSLYSIPWIRLDPFMRPVVENPRFSDLVAKYGTGATP